MGMATNAKCVGWLQVSTGERHTANTIFTFYSDHRINQNSTTVDPECDDEPKAKPKKGYYRSAFGGANDKHYQRARR